VAKLRSYRIALLFSSLENGVWPFPAPKGGYSKDEQNKHHSGRHGCHNFRWQRLDWFRNLGPCRVTALGDAAGEYNHRLDGLRRSRHYVKVHKNIAYKFSKMQRVKNINTYNSVGAFEINHGRLEVVRANALVCCFVQWLTGCFVTTRPGAFKSIAFAVRVASPISNPL